MEYNLYNIFSIYLQLYLVCTTVTGWNIIYITYSLFTCSYIWSVLLLLDSSQHVHHTKIPGILSSTHVYIWKQNVKWNSSKQVSGLLLLVYIKVWMWMQKGSLYYRTLPSHPCVSLFVLYKFLFNALKNHVTVTLYNWTTSV